MREMERHNITYGENADRPAELTEMSFGVQTHDGKGQFYRITSHILTHAARQRSDWPAGRRLWDFSIDFLPPGDAACSPINPGIPVIVVIIIPHINFSSDIVSCGEMICPADRNWAREYIAATCRMSLKRRRAHTAANEPTNSIIASCP